ncbi:bifunctional protein-serine/threonine kinase/phosphatase [Cellvibrio japonicus]|uniref:bifunctional protein-serine/threonine kinase/phosphatase n=1 Tax=Cellvibrio japonicus TaxID=155077 RepID=UPI0002DD84D1|nr:bifunctional protein-serine/threonine kinase/phosphatase [Cellvibrio japonicus]QEI12693.1 bifunctional protein-serine/threonine kinase/phosphatase [Cellvibrio japonicus]QEI16267.1 bifunctional protein-serine/threonine kinase/phosphatase [Cellvibrio japonicus]QEI19845.1 bifunctional protein-serine/threonine kinase/phosphatase [Cellvibrio japonicus]
MDSQQLRVSIGQYTSRGSKAVNQDFIGARLPREPLLGAKGIVLAIADGISSSQVSQIASETAVSGFIEDYYSTPDAWSTRHSAQRVLQAINSWLFSQTHNSPYRFDKDKGYICAFSTLIIKSRKAHILHSGDTRIYRLAGKHLELLTQDHRRVVDEETSYLTSALGIRPNLELDYRQIDLEPGDIFVLASDGVYDFFDPQTLAGILPQADDLNRVAKMIGQQALESGSRDNLSVQLVRVESLPDHHVSDLSRQASAMPLPPRLEARTAFDGYTIIRELYISPRSHVYVAQDNQNQQLVVIKVPSTEGRENPQYLERFLMEDWIARRLDNTHVLKAITQTRMRRFLYLVTEYIDGQTLTQWMQDNPNPGLPKVRQVVEQIAKGLQAFHRQEMVHRDLRPNNIMIDASGTVKIIDFGSTWVAGISESRSEDQTIHGTALYTAPECFLGEQSDARGDIYSLGVITYQMLGGGLPYGAGIARAQKLTAQRKLRYRSLHTSHKNIPVWVDECLRKAVHIHPLKRYQVLSEFIHDLHHPNSTFVNKDRPPLMERNPVLVWQCISLILLILLVVQWA